MKRKLVFRIFIAYDGFEPELDEMVIKTTRRAPVRESYDPVETSRTMDFHFSSRKAARNTKTRLDRLSREQTKLYVSRVIDENFF